MHMDKVPADKAKGETGDMGWVVQATGLLCLAELSDSEGLGVELQQTSSLMCGVPPSWI